MLAAGVLGALTGLTLGWVSEAMVLGSDFGAHPGLGIADVTVSLVIGFVVAEALIGKRFGRQPVAQTAAA